MRLMGTLLWMLFFWGVLHLAVPSATMRRDRTGNGLYYVGWMILVSSIVYLQYQVMSHAGHGQAALLIDGVAALLFLIGHVSLCVLRQRYGAATVPKQEYHTLHHASNDDASAPGLAIPHTKTTDPPNTRAIIHHRRLFRAS